MSPNDLTLSHSVFPVDSRLLRYLILGHLHALRRKCEWKNIVQNVATEPREIKRARAYQISPILTLETIEFQKNNGTGRGGEYTVWLMARYSVRVQVFGIYKFTFFSRIPIQVNPAIAHFTNWLKLYSLSSLADIWKIVNLFLRTKICIL